MKIASLSKIIIVLVAFCGVVSFSNAAGGQIILNSNQFVLTSTSLNISADAVGFSGPENIQIKYGTSSTTMSLTSGTFQIQPNSTFNHTLSGLTPSTTYYFEIVSTIDGTVYVPSSLFVTLASTGSVGVPAVTPVNPNCTPGQDGYCLLAPIGGLTVIRDVDLGNYFGIMYKILIGLAGALAVIMIFFGGVQYMTTDALGEKEEARERISNAVIGLIIALGSYAILNTINPKLLDFTFGIDKVSIEYEPDSHSLQPQVNGKYCSHQGGGYTAGTTWDTSNTEVSRRATLASLNISIQNPSICTTVGQPSCTSVSDLNLSLAASVRSKCVSCQLIVNGGTECWLHSPKTNHGKGSSTIDFDDTPSLQTFIQQDTNPDTSKPSWGTIYTVGGIKFVDEGDHIHVIE
jgi:hypothetical protein